MIKNWMNLVFWVLNAPKTVQDIVLATNGTRNVAMNRPAGATALTVVLPWLLLANNNSQSQIAYIRA
jgi:hypothetical protein